MNEPKYILLISILLICGITDILYKKIYNIITFPAIVLGIIMNYTYNGIPGLIGSMIGLFIAGIIFFMLFIWGAIGAGDAKLMIAIGAIVCVNYIFDFILCSVIVGGIMANIIAIKNKRFVQSWKNVFKFFLFLIPGLKLKSVPLKKENSFAFPFGYAISIGSLLYLYIIT